ITRGQLDLLADLRHRPAPAPVQRRTVEARVVALADEELEVALLAKDLVLEVLETPAHGDQPLWQRETVGVAEFPIEAEPREDLRDLLRRQGIQQALIDHLADDQSIVVEDVGQHVGLFGRVATQQVTEAMEHIADTANDGADSYILGVDLALEDLRQGVLFLFERVALPQRLLVLLPQLSVMERVCGFLLAKGAYLLADAGELFFQLGNVLFRLLADHLTMSGGDGVEVRQIQRRHRLDDLLDGLVRLVVQLGNDLVHRVDQLVRTVHARIVVDLADRAVLIEDVDLAVIQRQEMSDTAGCAATEEDGPADVAHMHHQTRAGGAKELAEREASGLGPRRRRLGFSPKRRDGDEDVLLLPLQGLERAVEALVLLEELVLPGDLLGLAGGQADQLCLDLDDVVLDDADALARLVLGQAPLEHLADTFAARRVPEIQHRVVAERERRLHRVQLASRDRHRFPDGDDRRVGAHDLAVGVHAAAPGTTGHLLELVRDEDATTAAVPLGHAADNDGSRGHVDAECEGVGREDDLHEAAGEEDLHELLQDREQSGVMKADALPG